MILSEDRRSHFAHLICNTLYNDDLVDFTDDAVALRLAKDAIEDFLQEFEALDVAVRNKILSLKRTVIEGSPEWETLYIKYYEEEIQRKGRA